MMASENNGIKIKMTADDISQAIGEWLYHQDKLPKGMEEGIVNFKVEEGEFVIEVYNPTVASASIN
jgi:alpha-galactosidase